MTDDITSSYRFYNTDGLRDLNLIKFLEGRSTFADRIEFKINATKKQVFDAVTKLVEENSQTPIEFKFFTYVFFVQTDTVYVNVRFDIFGTKTKPAGRYTISIYSEDWEAIEKIRNGLEKEFEGLDVNSVVWAISTPQGGIVYKEMDITGQHNAPRPSFYPWLKNLDIQEYFDHYLESEENVLLLMGVPGTGKTTFIKDFLVKNRLNAVITYDERLMRDDNFFLDFLTDRDGEETRNDVLIIEDADTMIADREKTENSILAKILNVSDGLIKNINKKIIFSTNLTDIDEIDPALIRPGRCYDVLDFRKLTYDESTTLLKDVGSDRELTQVRDYTLAELMSVNPRDQHFNKYKVGFGA
jgi:hypothetical protein